jgi:hypothetical protein
MAIDFSAFFQRAGKAAAENSPAILTALAVTGTITTAYLAAKGAIAATREIDSAEEENAIKLAEAGVDHAPLTFQEKAGFTWKCYVPSAVSAALTVAAIVSVNRIGERRAAAMATAYTIGEKAFKEYREKTLETVGKAKEQKIREEAAQARVDAHPIKETTVVYTGRGETRIYDTWNDRYFDHDIELIRRAVNDFNQKVLHDDTATLNDFWDLLGVNRTLSSERVGWDTDVLMEIEDTWVTVNGNPCLELGFHTWPKPLSGSAHR